MNISMDKYKTSELGKALKKVFHGQMTVPESVGLAEKEIAEVFAGVRTPQPPETDTDDGFFGDIVGKCPLCGNDVARTKFGYGCRGYRDNGCKFTVRNVICGRIISLSNMKLLLTNGKTSQIRGFISKNGKPFDAYLKLENGKVVFDFD